MPGGSDARQATTEPPAAGMTKTAAGLAASGPYAATEQDSATTELQIDGQPAAVSGTALMAEQDAKGCGVAANRANAPATASVDAQLPTTGELQ